MVVDDAHGDGPLVSAQVVGRGQPPSRGQPSGVEPYVHSMETRNPRSGDA